MPKRLDDFFSGIGLKISCCIEHKVSRNVSGAKSVFNVFCLFAFYLRSSFLPSTVCSEAVEMVMLYRNETNSGKGSQHKNIPMENSNASTGFLSCYYRYENLKPEKAALSRRVAKTKVHCSEPLTNS